ncbi:MAG: hypothetical protein RMK32_09635 [Anaerolineae bacterium]|nr:hypothetical protein [Thermoflexus sp.]MDW8065872.1 hypothetical protein [Anaerolineae bacterium]
MLKATEHRDEPLHERGVQPAAVPPEGMEGVSGIPFCRMAAAI